MATHSTRKISLLVLCLALSLFSIGCGCQEHEISAVTVTPTTPCLTINAGGGKASGEIKPGVVGACESLYLFGDNSCADPLVITMPAAAGEVPEEKTAAAGEAFEIKLGKWGDQADYTLEALLGSQQLSLHFVVGDQCGLTGSCD
jgi:hypothetical protein